MRFPQVTLTLSLLFLVRLLAVESSSLSNTKLVSNITRGSSLSLNDTTSPHWLSPSGNIAFGFYQLPCRPPSSNCSDRYVVGIWFVKSPSKTLVWTDNHNDLPLHRPSSILFTSEGKLMLRIMPENKEKPLISNLQEPASYAMMHDDGNFVLYGSDSQIVWESFDYPSDTILGGQSLRPGGDLISGNHRLSEIGGLVSTPATLKLDTTGELYLVGSDGLVLKYLHQNKNNQLRKQRGVGSFLKEDVHIYRAALDSEGAFNLYKERIDGNINSSDHNEKSSSILVQAWLTDQMNPNLSVLFLIIYFILAVLYGCVVWFLPLSNGNVKGKPPRIKS